MNKDTTILLVEDEVINAMLITAELNTFGYNKISHVTTGKGALENFEHEHVGMIIMDINLVGALNGIETVQILQKEHGKDVPVIYITGYDDQEIRTQAQGTSHLAYLIKPLDMVQLSSILDSYPA